MKTSPSELSKAVLVLRIAAVTLVAALVALLFTWQLFPTLSWSGATLALIQCLPLLLTLPGLVRGRRYTYKWATLCVLPYLIIGSTEVIANPLRRSGSAIMLLLALLLFAVLLGFLRTRSDLDPKIDPATRAQTAE